MERVARCAPKNVGTWARTRVGSEANMRFFQPIFSANRFIICALLLALVLLGGISVFFRYFLDAPIIWSEELTRFLGIWLVLLATGDCADRGMHVAFDLLQMKLGDSRVGYLLTIFINVMVIVFGIVLVTQSVFLIQGNWAEKSAVMSVSIAFMYMSLPLCGMLIIMGSVNQMLLSLKRQKTVAATNL